MAKISVVVPVYNSEKYINRCLDSIAAQTFSDFECIVVNDGSTDSSAEIINCYAKKDYRFLVIHQNNAGVSVARNAGLNICSGEWIAFVDSDDWCESNMLEEMYNAVKKMYEREVGLILCKVQDTAGSNVYNLDESYVYSNGKYGLCFQSVWGKLYRRNIITSHKLNFPVGVRLGEDSVFTFSFLTHSPNFYFINKPLYHYYNNREDSAVNTISYESAYSARNAFSMLSNYIIYNNCMKRFEKTLFDMKLWVKNLFVDQMKSPNPKEWRKSFPELNIKLIGFREDGKKREILYFLLVTHLYDVFRPILSSYKNRKSLGGNKI